MQDLEFLEIICVFRSIVMSDVLVFLEMYNFKF